MDNHYWIQQWADKKYGLPHIFGDVKEQVPEGTIKEHLNFSARKCNLETVGLEPYQFCHAHGQLCANTTILVDFDFSGLPCQDMSKANFKRKFFEGANGSCYLVWAKRHRMAKTPLLVVENVRDTWTTWVCINYNTSFLFKVCDFRATITILKLTPSDNNNNVIELSQPAQDIPLNELEALLPEYTLYQLLVEPEDIGHFAVARKRTYIFCLHGETGVYLYDVHEMYETIKRHMKTLVRTECQDYFVDGPRQRELHLQQIARTRNLKEPWFQ